jgi:Lrp/AsnC family leucine-responsive transcriptional regulator
MVKIDIKDKKILYQLDANSRQTASQIGKAVGLPKNIVIYRMKKLYNKGIIQDFHTIIDSYKLGYMGIRLHFLFQDTNPNTEKEIIEYFIKNKYTSLVITGKGKFDLSVMLWFKSVKEYYQFWQELQHKYCTFFQKQIFTFYIGDIQFRSTYLAIDYKKNIKRKELIICGGSEKVEINNIDYNIIKIMTRNARIPLSDIANKLNISADVARYRIKKLIKLKVIQGFRIRLNIGKLGYNFLKVYVYLKQYNMRNKIIEYIKSDPYLTCIDITACESHLELEYHLQNTTQLFSIMDDICTVFPDAIRSYEYVTALKVYKNLYMPEN